MIRKINNIHDKTFKAILSDMTVARDFFKSHLPKKIRKQINLNSLKLTQGSFVDKELSTHLTDLLYEVNFQSNKGYLYLLLESQSTPDKLLPFRVLKYLVQIIQTDLDRQKKTKKHRTLPLIYPMVYYFGKQSPYPYSMDIFDCFVNPGMAKDMFIKPAYLVDLTLLSDDELKRHGLVAGLELIQKHIYRRNMHQVLNKMLDEGMFVRIEHHSGKYLEVLIKYLIDRTELKQPEQFFKQLSEQVSEETGENIMTIAEYFEAKGRKVGEISGMQKGVKKGLEQGEGKVLKVAKNLLGAGLSIQFVSQTTGLSEVELKKIH